MPVLITLKMLSLLVTFSFHNLSALSLRFIICLSVSNRKSSGVLCIEHILSHWTMDACRHDITSCFPWASVSMTRPTSNRLKLKAILTFNCLSHFKLDLYLVICYILHGYVDFYVVVF